MDETRLKRRRSSISSDSSSSVASTRDSRSPSPLPVPKYHRASPSSDLPFTCNLPPTCSQPDTSTSYATEDELIRHQDTFHRWVCHTPVRDRIKPTPENGVPQAFVARGGSGKGWKECGRVFPDERFLYLHQHETHNPLITERQNRGEKTFQCFIPAPECTRVFLTPAKRRRHLIDKHRYPQQFYFNITNHGLNRIAEEDGMALSLIRPRREYVPRTGESPARGAPPNGNGVSQGLSKQQSSRPGHDPGPGESANRSSTSPNDIDMDGLVGSLESSLQFIPKGVRKKQGSKPNPS